MKPSVIYTTVEETLQAIIDVCKRFDAKAWLFGSYARNAAHAGSDIDIALLTSRFDEVETALEELDTTFSLDVVDLTQPHAKGVDDDRIRIA